MQEPQPLPSKNGVVLAKARVRLALDVFQKKPISLGVLWNGSVIARMADGNPRKNLLVDNSFVGGALAIAKLGDNGRAIRRGAIHLVNSRLTPLFKDGNRDWPVRTSAKTPPSNRCRMRQEIRMRLSRCDRVNDGHRFLLRSAPAEPEVLRPEGQRAR